MTIVKLEFTLIRRILQVLMQTDHWRLRHVLKEENKVIGFLAKMTSDNKKGVQIVDEVPRELIVGPQSLI